MSERMSGSAYRSGDAPTPTCDDVEGDFEAHQNCLQSLPEVIAGIKDLEIGKTRTFSTVMNQDAYSDLCSFLLKYPRKYSYTLTPYSITVTRTA